jgi:hypothetical protein
MNIYVGLCCRDERGLFTAKTQNISLSSGDGSEVGLYRESPMVCRLDGNGLRLGRTRYPCGDVRHHVGNLMWDEVTVDLFEARRMLKNLLDTGWTVEEFSDDGPLADLVKVAA